MLVPDSEEAHDALSRDDAALAPYANMLDDAVRQAEAGGDPKTILQALLLDIPPASRAALTRRFNFLLQERRPKPAPPAHDAPPAPEPSQAMAPAEPKKARFGLAQAALLMTTGTFDRIRALLSRRPDLQARIAEIGARMRGNGVTADLMLLERLETIQAQAMQRLQQQAREREQRNR